MTAHILEVAVDINLIAGVTMVRQFDSDLALPRHAAAQRLVDGFWQQPGMRWLPVGVHPDVHQKRFFALPGGKIEIQRLMKPGRAQRFAIEIAIHEAEIPAQVLQSGV